MPGPVLSRGRHLSVLPTTIGDSNVNKPPFRGRSCLPVSIDRALRGNYWLRGLGACAFALGMANVHAHIGAPPVQPRVVQGADYFHADGAGDGTDAAIAAGEHSVAAGALATAQGNESLAFGYGSQAFGDGSLSIGTMSAAYASYSSAIGYMAAATANYSTAIGYGTGANGESSLAIGGYGVIPDASGFNTVEALTSANGYSAVAIGTGATADADLSLAIGAGATASGDQGVAVGMQAQAIGPASTAMGNFATADGLFAAAIGYNADAQGERATAVGVAAIAHGYSNTAIGGNSIAMSDLGSDTAVGTSAMATGGQSAAVGSAATAQGFRATALGTGAYSLSDNAIAIGTINSARGVGSIAMGAGAMTGGQRPSEPTDPGDGGPCWICRSVSAADVNPVEGADDAIAIGTGAHVFGTGNLAIGAQTRVLGDNSVALGAGSTADRDNVVSVGASTDWVNNDDGSAHVALTRQLINVAAGTEATDAVNVDQLDQAIASATNGALASGDQLARVFGGGASYGVDGFVAPTYTIHGASYDTVGDAFGALGGLVDGALQSIHDISTRLDAVTVTPVGSGNGMALGNGSVATDGRDTAIGNGATIGADGSTALGSNATITAAATNAVAIGADANVSAPSGTALGQAASVTAANSVALGANAVADEANTVSVGNASAGRRITHVTAGVSGTDAANVSQVDQAVATAKTYADAGDVRTLGTANAYTDSKVAGMASTADLNALRGQMDDRFHAVDNRLDRLGATSAASTQMAINAGGATSPRGRFAVGAGVQGGQKALAIGYAAPIGERARVSLGGAFSGSEHSAGIGFGVDL